MSDSKQRAKGSSVVRVVSASEQERVAMAQFLTNRTAPKGNDQKRHARLYEHFQLDAADAASERIEDSLESEAEAKGRPRKAVRFSSFSADLVDYETTQDVIDYFTDATKDGIPGLWVNYLVRVKDRMDVAASTRTIDAEPAAG